MVLIMVVRILKISSTLVLFNADGAESNIYMMEILLLLAKAWVMLSRSRTSILTWTTRSNRQMIEILLLLAKVAKVAMISPRNRISGHVRLWDNVGDEAEHYVDCASQLQLCLRGGGGHIDS